MNPRMLRHTGAAILFAALTFCCGCEFERDWAAAANYKPLTRTDITGRWKGEWASEAGPHKGSLRCLMTRIDLKTYHARYAATYWGIFGFSYDMDLTADQLAEAVKFQGDADLGAMAGGVYHYDGKADWQSFTSTYSCSQDHGRFTMQRPE